MSESELVVARSDSVVTLTLNRLARRNALSVGLRDAISDALDDAVSDPGVKVVVITGVGSVFSAGFDLREFEQAAGDPEFDERLWASSDRYHRAVLTCALPTIAIVNGPAIAGGFDLAVLCDLRIAARTARFAHPERSFGDVVYGPLHDLVGGAIARELTMGGREVDADEALALHLVNEVVDAGDLAAAAQRWIERVCVAPRDVLIRLKAKTLARAQYGADVRTLEL